jgi:hypothetical protein
MDNTLVINLFEKLKERKTSVPGFSRLTGIPKERVYKWKQEGTNPKAEDEKKIKAWIEGTNVEISTNTQITPEGKGGEDLMRILANLSESHKNLTAAHKEIAQSNNKLAENEREILRKVPTAGVHTDTPSDELATLVGIREFVIELFADVKKTSPQEAEAVLGTKVVAAKKRVRKMGIPSGASK